MSTKIDWAPLGLPTITFQMEPSIQISGGPAFNEATAPIWQRRPVGATIKGFRNVYLLSSGHEYRGMTLYSRAVADQLATSWRRIRVETEFA